MQADWELSQSLQSDGHGVRCVAAAAALSNAASSGSSSSSAPTTTMLLAGSQGGTVSQFDCACGGEQRESTAIRLLPYQHDHAVTAIAVLPNSGGSSSHHRFATGCKDHAVRVFETAETSSATNAAAAGAGAAADSTSATTTTTTVTLLKELRGHEKPVTSLDVIGEHFLLSGSWDGTARLWNLNADGGGALVATLPDHENSVCVCGLDYDAASGLLTAATGSAGRAASSNNSVTDHAVRLWHICTATGAVQLRATVANDHDGPIRDLVHLQQHSLLATCSNDGTVKLRRADTLVCRSTLVPFAGMQQHPPMLLSLAYHGSGGGSGDFLAAAAEDGHVAVWGLDRGGHRDSTTNNTATIAAGEPQILRHPDCVWQVAVVPNSSSSSDDADLATACQDGVLRVWTRAAERQAPLPEREALAEAVQSKLQAAQSGPTAAEVAQLPRWELNADRRGTAEGQVQLFQRSGVAIAAQWSAASQTWIEVGEVTGQANTGTVDGVQYDHVFPIEVDQTGGGGVAHLQIGYNTGENPFQAAQRFIDAHVLPQHHLQEVADYIQQRAGQAPRTLGATATSATTAASSGTPMVTYDYLPARGYKSFELPSGEAATTFDKMKAKMQEFGCLTEEDAQQSITALMETLAATNRYHSSKVSDAQLQTALAQLQSTDPQRAFPVLDLLRLTVLHPDAAGSARAPYWKTVTARVVTLCQTSTGSGDSASAGPAAAAVPLLSLRLLANAFRGGPGAREAVASQLPAVVQCARAHAPLSSRSVRLAVATVLHNAALCLHQERQHSSSSSSKSAVSTSMVPLLDQIITANTYEAEALFRSLVALGTLVLADGTAECKAAANARHLASKVEPAASPHTDPVKAVAKEVYSVLQ